MKFDSSISTPAVLCLLLLRADGVDNSYNFIVGFIRKRAVKGVCRAADGTDTFADRSLIVLFFELLM